MIRLINITPVVKQRVKEMVLTLMPEVGYVRVSNSGIITFKRKWYSLKRVQTNITDLLIGVLPIKIAEFTANKQDGLNYVRLFNQDISNILSMRLYNPMFDICEYVWTQYNKHCVDMPDIVINTNNELIFLKKHNYLPSIKPLSSVKAKDLIRTVQGTQKDRISRRMVNEINRMKNFLPVAITRISVDLQDIVFKRKLIFTTT